MSREETHRERDEDTQALDPEKVAAKHGSHSAREVAESAVRSKQYRQTNTKGSSLPYGGFSENTASPRACVIDILSSRTMSRYVDDVVPLLFQHAPSVKVCDFGIFFLCVSFLIYITAALDLFSIIKHKTAGVVH